MPPLLTFPDLETKQIVMIMNELGGNLEEKNLLTPTAEVMWPLYETVALSLLGIPREELQQPAFKVLCKLEYSELHEESVCSLASWRIIRQLMFAAGVTDFTWRDLVKPESRRTIRNLSGLINYARFRAEREDKLAALQDESLLETKQQLEDEIEEAKRQLAAFEVEKKNQIPAVQVLEACTAELWQEVSVLNKKQSVCQNEIRALKQELNSVNDAISGQNYMLQQGKQEGSDLRGQIVQSPEKLQKRTEEQKLVLEQTEIDVEEARKCLKRWEQKLESYTKAERKVLNYLGRVEAAQKVLTTQKTATKHVKALKGKIKADEVEERRQNTKLAELTLKGLVLTKYPTLSVNVSWQPLTHVFASSFSAGDHWKELIDNGERLNLAKTEEAEKGLEEIKNRYSQLIKRLQEADLPKKEAQGRYLLTQIADIVEAKEEVITNSRKQVAGIQQQVLEYYRALLSCTGPIPQLSG